MKVFKPDKNLTVRVGEEFAVSLNVLAAAGYEWQLLTADPAVEYQGSSFTPTGGGVGGESSQLLRFRVTRPGTFNLQLGSKRAWDASPAEKIQMQVTARANP